MVAWIGYQEIIFFKDLKENDYFASTKNGKHYHKLFQLGVDKEGKFEIFDDKELVYINIPPEGPILF